MKKHINSFIKTITKDRLIMSLLIANVVVALVLAIIIGLTIQPSETQVVTRYTAYGVTNFYRSHWYTILNYIGLELVVLMGHTFLSLKLIQLKRRSLAIVLMALTIGLLVMIYLFARSIIKIAALG